MDENNKNELVEQKPGDMILKNVAKLIDVKTIITLSVISAMIYLAVTGKVQPDSIKDFGLMIVGYFFGTKKSAT